MVNQPVLSHERDFSLGRRNGEGGNRGEVTWMMAPPQGPQPAPGTPSPVHPMEQPQEPALPRGPGKRWDTVQEVAPRYLSFPVSPRNRSSNCFMRPGETT